RPRRHLRRQPHRADPARRARPAGEGGQVRRAGGHRLRGRRRRMEVPVDRGLRGHDRRGRGASRGPALGLTCSRRGRAVSLPCVSDIVVFSGSAHRKLAEEICSNLGVVLSPSVTTRFSNDCLQVQLLDNCRQKDVYIVQPLVPPTQDHLMELLLMVDAARGASAASVTVVVPHYAYARSDKKDASRISIGGKLVADLMATAGVRRVVTMTLHAPQVHGFFAMPVDHLTALGELAEHYRAQDLSDAIVVSPDFGNAKTASQFARLLGLPVAAGSKQR